MLSHASVVSQLRHRVMLAVCLSVANVIASITTRACTLRMHNFISTSSWPQSIVSSNIKQRQTTRTVTLVSHYAYYMPQYYHSLS
jgi:hypothetical protein